MSSGERHVAHAEKCYSKFPAVKHFYGRVAPEGILALHMEIDLFTAAERPKLIFSVSSELKVLKVLSAMLSALLYGPRSSYAHYRV